VVDGALQLVSDVLWDSLPGNIDDWGYVDSRRAASRAGQLHLRQHAGHGSIGSYRLDANIVSNAFDANDLWDSRTDLMDDWGLVDGAAIEDAEATLMVRVSNDNLSYGPWHAMGLSAEYSDALRAVPARLQQRQRHAQPARDHARRLRQA
jgi:hypothetical protein